MAKKKTAEESKPDQAKRAASKSEIDSERERQKTEAEILDEIQEAMARTPVKDFAMQFLVTLSSLAYQRLGIYQDPEKVAIDLAQAKLAIDCYAELTEALKESLTADEDQTLNSVLSSLRMAYVQKNK